MSQKTYEKKMNTYRSAQTILEKQHEALVQEVRRFKNFIALSAAYFIASIGVLGVVLTCWIDVLRKRPLEWQWLQITALCIFAFVFLVGATFVSLLLKKEE